MLIRCYKCTHPLGKMYACKIRIIGGKCMLADNINEKYVLYIIVKQIIISIFPLRHFLFIMIFTTFAIS